MTHNPTPTLAEEFEIAVKAVPELRPHAGADKFSTFHLYVNPKDPEDGPHWSDWVWTGKGGEDQIQPYFAASLILAACVRMLPEAEWHEVSSDGFRVGRQNQFDQNWEALASGPTLEIAYLRAVVAVYGKKENAV